MEPITIALGLAKVAPIIYNWFKSEDKQGDAAEAVIDIAKVVTGEEDGEDALKVINADPAMALQYQMAVLAQANELDKLYLADVQNARAMQTAALAQEDLFSKRFVYYFASIWSVFTMFYFILVTTIQLNDTGMRIADTILGVLITAVVGVMFNFFYGSNRKSQQKDDTISILSSTAVPTAPAMKTLNPAPRKLL